MGCKGSQVQILPSRPYISFYFNKLAIFLVGLVPSYLSYASQLTVGSLQAISFIHSVAIAQRIQHLTLTGGSNSVYPLLGRSQSYPVTGMICGCGSLRCTVSL